MMRPDYQVGIVGAGFGGIVAALKLKNSGRNSFVIFERAAEVGGTWRDNIYPGCACDIPSHLYSISSAPNPEWNHAYSRQPEILNYLKKVVARNDLKKHIRYHADIVEAKFTEEFGFWALTDRQGNRTTVQVVLLALGSLNRPNIPAFKGLENFRGKKFHSSQWDYSYDFAGKRVAVIGTGASAIQIIPSIAPVVSHLAVFQRTPAWVAPRRDKKISRFKKALYKNFAFVQTLEREKIYWRNEFLGLAFVGHDTLNKVAAWIALRKLKNEVKDPATRKKLTPNYKLGCKRVLKSDDYYPVFNRPNVSLVTESIAQIGSDRIITQDGQEHQVDAIILGTGFVAADIDIETKIFGRNGSNLIDEWRINGAEAYRGMTVSGYPNLAFLLGPNTGLGHNSVVHMMESQMNYILEYIKSLEQAGEGAFWDLRPEAQKKYNEKIQRQFTNTVWASGCKSWYINANGKNTILYPRLTVKYRRETRNMDIREYALIRPPVYEYAQCG